MVNDILVKKWDEQHDPNIRSLKIVGDMVKGLSFNFQNIEIIEFNEYEYMFNLVHDYNTYGFRIDKNIFLNSEDRIKEIIKDRVLGMIIYITEIKLGMKRKE